MKKLTAILLAALLVFSFAACGQNGGPGKTGEVSVFYYTFSDTYISSVRTAMDSYLKANNIEFNNYDANGNQTTQTEQVQTAIAKGSSMLIVNVVDTGSNDAAQNIVNLAKAANIPVVFFNRSVDESVVSSYDKCVFVGTDYEMAGHMQGKMIGEYLVENYGKVDLNGDGKISYVMFKGQEGNMEAIARTQYGVDDCNAVLTAAGKPFLEFYDPSNTDKYLVDQDGLWSSAAATNYLSTALAQYSEANGNMIELVIANNDEMALGAAEALERAGDTRGVKVVGIDGTPQGIEGLKSGKLYGTVQCDSDEYAEVIFEIAAAEALGQNVQEKVELEDGTYYQCSQKALTVADLP